MRRSPRSQFRRARTTFFIGMIRPGVCGPYPLHRRALVRLSVQSSEAPRRMSLGRVGGFKVARAREIAGELHAQVQLGRNISRRKRAPPSGARFPSARWQISIWTGARTTSARAPFSHKTTHLLKYAAPLHRMSVDAVEPARSSVASHLARAGVRPGFGRPRPGHSVGPLRVGRSNKRLELPEIR